MAIMILVVELEDEQETPKAGSLGDWHNDQWDFLDVAVATTVRGADVVGVGNVGRVVEAINAALSGPVNETILANDPQNKHNEVPHFEKIENELDVQE